MSTISITERASRYVAKMDAAVSGSGGHDATFAVARALVHGFLLSESDAMALMAEYNLRCSPPWSDRELAYKLRSAANAASAKAPGYLLGESRGDGRESRAPREWKASEPVERPVYDPELLAREAGSLRVKLDYFANRSYADPSLMSSDDFLKLLYAGEKVVIFSEDRSQGQALWPDEPIPSPSQRGMWFLAQPVDGLTHDNPRTGKPSRRSEESVTRWKYALLESDEAPASLWLSALAQSRLPIAAIYSSGGRSVHALVRVTADPGSVMALGGARTKQEWDAWAASCKEYLTRLGADPRALTAVRLTRLPQQFRPEKGNLQKLLYVNPFPPFGNRIMDLEPRRDVKREVLKGAQDAVFSQSIPLMNLAADRLEYYSACDARFAGMAAEMRQDAEALTKATSGSGERVVIGRAEV